MQNSKSIILGITCYNAHDSAACIIQNGTLIAFAEEERFTRKKHDNSYPYQAVEFCLAQAGIINRDSIIAGFYWKPLKEILGNIGHMLRYFPRSLYLLRANHARLSFAKNLFLQMSLPQTIRKRHGFKKVEFHFIEHHLTHAASAFFVSGFDDAAIVTLDSRGEDCAGIIAEGSAITLRKLREFSAIHESIGNLYAAFTDFLGFRVNHDEWKVMGLAAYGNTSYIQAMEDVVYLLPKGKWELDLSYFSYHIYGQKKWYSKKSIAIFGSPRKHNALIEQRHKDIAFALQYVLEKIALHIVSHIRKISTSRNLCLAGGVALNCLMNSRILKEGGFDNIFVQPAAHDAGCALGAAYYVHHCIKKNPERFIWKHAYWGPSYSNEEIQNALRKKNVHFKEYPDAAPIAAKAISEGKVVGWFQGRMEAGPRALGNRSIVADPRRPDMKNILNIRVKNRETFRPFAPSVLEERASEYFDLTVPAPYMILTATVKDRFRSSIPAVVHVDGTARVQTVNLDTNPDYWRLIKHFEELTGIPIVLNTSFNENEPIVCKPEEAIECFLRTKMDMICLGNFVAEKKP